MTWALKALGSMVALAAPGTAWAGTCIAQAQGEPAITPDLAMCLSAAQDGDIIELMPGSHAADGLVISRSVTIRPHLRNKSAWLVSTTADDPSLLLYLRGSGAPYLLDDTRLLIIDVPGSTVHLEDVQVAPPSVAGVAVGRAFEVRAGELSLTGVSLPEETLRYVTKSVGLDQVGGALARVMSGGSLAIGPGCDFAGVSGPRVDGALVHASGTGAMVTVRGRVGISGIEAQRGALFASGGASITVESDGSGEDPTFRDLRAEHGAAIFAGPGGIISVSAGAFLDNRVPLLASEGVGRGGHLAAEQGTLTVEGGVFAGGQASAGGAIAGFGSDVNIRGGTYHFDRGTIGKLESADRNQAWRGGVVWVDDGSGALANLELSHVVLEYGLARYGTGDEAVGRGRPAGGAVYAVDVPVTLDNVDIVDSVVIDEGSGGGFACQGCSITGTELTVERSTARFGGGASWVGGSASLTASTFRSNGEDSDTLVGGGVLAVGVDLSLIEPVVTQNRARQGGGLAVFGVLDAVLTGGLISANEAENGAGVLATVQRLTLDGTQVTLNRATDVGGGVAVRDAFTVRDDSIALTAPELVLEGVQLEGNTARDGGGAWSSGVGVRVLGGAIDRNLARETGGGILVQKSTLELRDTSVLDNLAGVDGGGVATWLGPVQIWDSVFARNEAGQGAALLMHEPVGAQVVRNRICGNIALDGGTITLVGDETPSDTNLASVSNNLIVGTQDSPGGGLVLQGAGAVVHHNHFFGQSGFAVDAVASDLDLHHNLVHWGAQGPMIRHQGQSVEVERNLFWRSGDVDVIGVDGGGSPWLDRADVRVQHPHLRGYLRSGAPFEEAGACQWSAHHPRPSSPLLAAVIGTDAVGPSPDHAGVFGGDLTPLLPWRTNQDGDSSKLIFDCDDSNRNIGDRFVQYIDADGDGLGGDVWGGDDCVPVPGAVIVGGDCDDSSVEVGADCPEAIRYYGRTCSTSGPPMAGALAVLLLLGATRRRRFDG